MRWLMLRGELQSDCVNGKGAWCWLRRDRLWYEVISSET